MNLEYFSLISSLWIIASKNHSFSLDIPKSIAGFLHAQNMGFYAGIAFIFYLTTLNL